MAPAGAPNRKPDDPDGPFYNNPLLEPVVKSFKAIPQPDGGCLERVAKAAGMGLAMGVFYNLVAVPWNPDPYEFFPKGTVKMRDNWQFFRQGFSRPMTAFSIVAMTFSGVECLMEGIRDHERQSEHWNAAMGGFASGVTMGAMTRRLDIALVTGGAVGIFMGMLTYNGLTFVSDPYQMAMKVGGKWPKHFKESPELAALKEKYPECSDL